MQVDIKASANKILVNVEANERQVKQQIEGIEAQQKKISEQLLAMRGALKEMEIMKTMLIALGTQPALARAVESLLSVTDDPTEVCEAANG